MLSLLEVLTYLYHTSSNWFKISKSVKTINVYLCPIQKHQIFITIKKENKLKSTKSLELVYKQGKTYFVYPIKTFVLKPDVQDEVMTPVKIAVSVSKKYYPRAVDRNAIKRRMRESLRLIIKEGTINMQGYQMICIYVGKTILDSSVIDKSMHTLTRRICRD